MRRRLSLVLVLTLAAVSLTACKNRYGYDAQIESIDINAASVEVHGWYHDPLLDQRGTLCADVIVTIDGVAGENDRGCNMGGGRRPDVERLTGQWSFGFSRFRMSLHKGSHTACVTVVPPGAEVPSVPNHCRNFDVGWDQFSQGVIDDATVTNGVLVAGGWYAHVPFTSSSGLFRPTWYVDGGWVRGPTPPVTVETVDRPDAVAAVGFFAVGYRLSMPVDPGPHTVCLGLDDGFGGGGPPSICRTVVAP